MKKRLIQRLKKYLGIFTLTLGLCSCSGVNTLNNECSIKKVRAEDNVIKVSGVLTDAEDHYFNIDVKIDGGNVSFAPSDDSQITIPANDTYFVDIFIPTLEINSQQYVNIIYFNYTNDILPIVNNSNYMTISLYNYGVDGNLDYNNIQNAQYQTWGRYYNELEDITVTKIANNYPYNYTFIYPFNNEYWYTYNNYGVNIRFEITNNRLTAFTKNVYQNILTNFGLVSNGNLMTFTNETLTESYDNGYNEGYNVGVGIGKQQGQAIGKQDTISQDYQGKTYEQIYHIGYSQAESDLGGSTTLIPSLFGAIVNIPISVLNGLVPLTFFDISIIRIALTFLALGVVMWIIRKVLI